MGENNSLEKKLGVWGKDKIVREDGKTYAKDFYCVECYSKKKEVPADSFFPLFDPDIPVYPYCQKHIDEMRVNLLLGTIDEHWAD